MFLSNVNLGQYNNNQRIPTVLSTCQDVTYDKSTDMIAPKNVYEDTEFDWHKPSKKFT